MSSGYGKAYTIDRVARHFGQAGFLRRTGAKHTDPWTFERRAGGSAVLSERLEPWSVGGSSRRPDSRLGEASESNVRRLSVGSTDGRQEKRNETNLIEPLAVAEAFTFA